MRNTELFVLGMVTGAAGLWLAERSAAQGRLLRGKASTSSGLTLDPALAAGSAATTGGTVGLIQEGLSHLSEQAAMELEFQPAAQARR